MKRISSSDWESDRVEDVVAGLRMIPIARCSGREAQKQFDTDSDIGRRTLATGVPLRVIRVCVDSLQKIYWSRVRMQWCRALDRLASDTLSSHLLPILNSLDL